jgi:hypothetical protein
LQFAVAVKLTRKSNELTLLGLIVFLAAEWLKVPVPERPMYSD